MVAVVMYFVAYMPWSYIEKRYLTLTRAEKMAVCLDLNIALPMGLVPLSIYEATGRSGQVRSGQVRVFNVHIQSKLL